MKKFLALLLAAVMVLSMAACGKKDDTKTTDPSADASGNTTATGKHENKVIMGQNTELTGDFTGGVVTNGGSDMMVDKLVNDYGTLVTDREGVYVENPTVLDSFERTDHEDGSATYTVKIKEGLKYSNGDPITAKDFAFKVMLNCTPFATAMKFKTATDMTLVGGSAAKKGETPVLAGLHLIDEYTLSLDIVPQFAQYYYAYTYAGVTPWNAEFWLGKGYSVADDGEGCYITKDGEKITLEGGSDAEAHFRKSMSAADGTFVSAGPYKLVKYDPATKQATLEINENYAGNFEGQKPSIQTIIMVQAVPATWADQMKTGAMDVYAEVTDGKDINTLMDMIDAGEPFQAVEYNRAGYGKIQFLCDVGPTQFKEVRHAVAYLLNRDEFIKTFCKGWGNTIDAPYAEDMKMYKDSKDFLADNLTNYSFNKDEANKQLTEGGWTLNSKGEEWKVGDGLRHKDVTDLDVNKDGCIEVGGKKLMPLKIVWYATDNNPVSDLLSVLLANAEVVKEAGMEIEKRTGDFDGVLNAIYHVDAEGKPVAPEVGMLNLATGFNSSMYDYSFNWTDDPEMMAQGYNGNWLIDKGEGGLDDLSMRMVYDVKEGDYDSYLDLWQKYLVRWNEMLPELPLYNNICVAAVPTWVEGYEQSAFWDFSSAILYASIPSAQ